MQEAFEKRHGLGTWSLHTFDQLREEFMFAWVDGFTYRAEVLAE